MINNLEIIKSLLKFDSEDDFYHAQIIKRKKEHKELGSNSYIVKTYYIKSIEDLDFYFPEMKCLADFHNARVCINLNKRSFENIAFQTLQKTTNQIMNKDWKSVRKAYNSVCGTYSAAKNDKRWIIDIDEPYSVDVEQQCINFINSFLPEGNKHIATLPTKNGFHIICSPFNIEQWKKMTKLPYDIHKDNPSLIYIP